MQSAASPDLSNLAHLAQHPDAELRPLLLRVQAQAFAEARRRDAATVKAFEALALGLIPLVTDDVLSVTSALLRSVPETPASVLSALTARLVRSLDEGRRPGGEPEHEEEQASSPAEIAGDPDRVLDGRLLAHLVDEARDNAALAALLLARPEPSALDRAALYRHADEAGRARIRDDLKSASPLWMQPARAPAPERMRALVLRAAEIGDVIGLQRLTAWHLGLAPEGRFDLVTEPGRELFVCTLLAFGFQPAECIRIVLSADTAMSRSVSTVFGLASLARSTPVWVANVLAGCHRAHASAARAGEAHADRPQAVAGHLRADGRVDPPVARTGPADPSRQVRTRSDERGPGV